MRHDSQYYAQAVDNLMPGFDKEIAKMAQRILINPRKIDFRTGVLATKVTPGWQNSLSSMKVWLLGLGEDSVIL